MDIQEQEGRAAAAREELVAAKKRIADMEDAMEAMRREHNSFRYQVERGLDTSEPVTEDPGDNPAVQLRCWTSRLKRVLLKRVLLGLVAIVSRSHAMHHADDVK